jgi:hypothetical protein
VEEGVREVAEMGPTFLGNKPLHIPEPKQRVRLRAGRRSWRGNFRAVSYPYTDEAGEVVIRVARESEYQDAIREGRRAVAIAWPVRQLEVVSFPDDENKTQELPQRSQQESDRAQPRSSTPGSQEAAEPRSWWRRAFGG